ncbi:MAG: hypothetical protein PHP61_02500 [Candidatus Izemoplasmatales bacterium]|jgi:hypothetical protein|nr:hypothetical protein [Candidatus Izemoplasmatales bacterium]MDD4988323.1 hypothetical protein [Candidatus Izemoplasmatales bacterium]MDY0373251.1 hypothetical protein [Candidatus Izemoplasmatales bacterium]NLF48827.1 hypothetical protein [Acholeplasmataceae bacterium]
MERITREFLAWNKENVDFYQELQEHDTSLYTRFQPVYEVLRFLASEQVSENHSLSIDEEKIMSVGLEYLHDQFSTCKLYLESFFQNDFHRFIVYDRVVSALLLCEDIRYELSDKNDQKRLDALEMLMEELESLLEEEKPLPDNFKLYLDDQLHQILGSRAEKFLGIIDIFVNIAETLGLDLETTPDKVIGKEIKGE